MGTFKDLFTAAIGVAAPTKIVCKSVLMESLKRYGISMSYECIEEVYATLANQQLVEDKKRELELALKGTKASSSGLEHKSELATRCDHAAYSIFQHHCCGDSEAVIRSGLVYILEKYGIDALPTPTKELGRNHQREISIVVSLNDGLMNYTGEGCDVYAFSKSQLRTGCQEIDTAMNMSGAYQAHFGDSKELFLLAFSGFLHIYAAFSKRTADGFMQGADEWAKVNYAIARAEGIRLARRHLAYCVSIYHPSLDEGDGVILLCQDGAVCLALKRHGESEAQPAVIASTNEAAQRLAVIYEENPSLRL